MVPVNLIFLTLSIHYLFQFQYSILHKKENAHEESIWSCAWGRAANDRKKRADNQNGDENSRYVLFNISYVKYLYM